MLHHRIQRRDFLRSAAALAGSAALWPTAISWSKESDRAIARISRTTASVDGAGVKLQRAFGFTDPEVFDPFLLLDDFRNDRPEDYQAGFPWHPHRGIETITYMLAGRVEHEDSLGNAGVLAGGDVQWMTAGRGILHQEMPKGDDRGRVHGFQLWANLPAAKKMIEPRYQDVPAAEVPEVREDDGTRVRIVCGTFAGKQGPVDGVFTQPRYLDVDLPAGVARSFPVEHSRHVFAYVFAGGGWFHHAGQPRVGNRELVVFDHGDDVVASAGDSGMRFLLISGEPLYEPIAWRGPIVMNTQEELDAAFRELREGTFIK